MFGLDWLDYAYILGLAAGPLIASRVFRREESVEWPLVLGILSGGFYLLLHTIEFISTEILGHPEWGEDFRGALGIALFLALLGLIIFGVIRSTPGRSSDT